MAKTIRAAQERCPSERGISKDSPVKSDKIFATDFFTGGNKRSVKMCLALMSHKGKAQPIINTLSLHKF